ncbi:MAG TPA: hypothetical protein VD757_01490 [Candidatus Nitrosocosmicus sp.]|nr:hypothetical protein [Candidatus Nitrosocosmicus sp.]
MKRVTLLLSIFFLFAACFSVSAQELTADTQLNFDKAAYYGYRAKPEIVLTDDNLNNNADQIDEVSITVKSTSDPAGISVGLVEDAADSGVFRGYVYIDPAKSNDLSNVLKITSDDSITAVYNGRGNSKSYTCTAAWKPSTDIVEFNKDTYSGLYASATVVVNDRALNLSPSVLDKTVVVITSDIDSTGLILTLNETGFNTGMFSGSFIFNTTISNSKNGVLKVGTASSITASYKGAAAKAAFTFNEATIATSAENDSGEGNMLDVIVYEPDNNNPDAKDRITVKLGSGSSTDDLTVGLEETGVNTGKFKQTVYFTDKESNKNQLYMDGMNKVNIKYTDRTVPEGGSKEIVKTIRWEYMSSLITLDKKSYVGYNTSAKITLYNMDLNKHSDKVEDIDVEVATGHSEDLKLELKETKANSGVFTGKIYFGQSTKRSKDTIKMTGEDSITVSFTNPRKKSDIVECSANWSPQEAMLTLNRQVYSGNGAVVTITLEDWDVADDSAVKDEVSVSATVPGTSKKKTLTLTETKKDSGVFTGTLYINGTESPSIDLQAGETLKIAYTDKTTKKGVEEIKTASAVWTGISKAELSLDQTIYKGYETYMVITVKDPDINRMANECESTEVLVKTSANGNGVKYSLKETGTDTGVFTASLKLSKDSPDSSSVKVNDTDKITVIYINKNMRAAADFSK